MLKVRGEGGGLWLLGVMLVLGVGVHAQHLEAMPAQLVLGQHAPHGLLQHALWMALSHAPRGQFLQASGVACVPAVEFATPLVACESDVAGVGHHHIVAAVEGGIKGRFVLSDQQLGDLRSEPSGDLFLGVNEEPVLLRPSVLTWCLRVSGEGT